MYVPDDPDLYTYLIATWPFLFSAAVRERRDAWKVSVCRERHRRKKMLSPSVIFVVVKQALKRSV